MTALASGTAPPPTASPAELEAWIRTRLDPLEAYDRATRDLHSDYDLNPSLHPGEVVLHPAAVLIPLVEREGGMTVLLTRRADSLRSHTGQVAFPGGRCDAGETPWDAALREAREEIGLDPGFVSLAGMSTGYQTVSDFHVIPVVGFVRPGFTLTPNPTEVAEVFEAPFAFLMDPANHERRFHDQPDTGVRRYYYAMPFEDRFIWGATAGMLRVLYNRLYGD